MDATAALREEMERIRWFHRIDLGNGLVTPGTDDTATKLAQVHLPADLTGKAVLDIGAWDGFFSFECERRGAGRVVALDGGVWKVGSIGKAGFEFARKALNSRVEDVWMDVSEIGPERLGQFDLVLFLGVLYHLQDPYSSFMKVASVAPKDLIIETHVDLVEVDTPAMAFYPGDECAGDPSNWCGPNRAAVEGLLRCAGFRTIRAFPMTPVDYPTVGRPQDKFGRMVFHASR